MGATATEIHGKRAEPESNPLSWPAGLGRSTRLGSYLGYCNSRCLVLRFGLP